MASWDGEKYLKRVEAVETEVQNRRHEIASLCNDRNKLSKELNALLEEIAIMEKQDHPLRKKHATWQAAVESQTIVRREENDDINKYRQQKRERAKQKALLQAERSALQSQLANKTGAHFRLEKEARELTAHLERINTERLHLKTVLENIQREMREDGESFQDLRLELERVQCTFFGAVQAAGN